VSAQVSEGFLLHPCHHQFVSKQTRTVNGVVQFWCPPCGVNRDPCECDPQPTPRPLRGRDFDAPDDFRVDTSGWRMCEGCRERKPKVRRELVLVGTEEEFRHLCAWCRGENPETTTA